MPTPKIAAAASRRTPRPAEARPPPKKSEAVEGKKSWAARTPAPVSDFRTGAAARIALPEGKKDVFYDGALIGANGKAYPAGTPPSQVPPVVPKTGAPVGKAIMVNGIRTEKAIQATDLQNLADKTGMAVVGIHNSTAGAALDTVQSMLDKLNRLQDHFGGAFDTLFGKLTGKNPLAACQKVDLSNNPAANTLRATLLESLEKGEPVHLVAHSQGALIVASALGQVKQQLEGSGISRADAEARMSKITVETFGGAAHTYPDGPRYVHYVNKKDGVPGLMGLGVAPSPGRDAVVKTFSDAGAGKLFNFPCHYVETYLAHRVPFEEAFATR